LIAAVLAAGGISLLDALVLQPRLKLRRELALREQAVKVRRAIDCALSAQQQHLLAACRHALAEREGTELPQRAAGLADADAAWLCEPNGTVRDVWSRVKWSLSPGVVAGALSAGGDPNRAPSAAGPAAGEVGLLRMGADMALFARVGRRGGQDGGPSPGGLYVVRRVDGGLLAELGAPLSGEIALLEANALPHAGRMSSLEPYLAWAAPDGGVALARPARGAADKPLGYWRAHLPVPESVQQAVSSRRATLTVLWSAAAVLIIAVIGVRFFAQRPIRRLMRRLHEVESGSRTIDELSDGLDAEPLILARKLQGALESMSALSLTDEMTGLANRRQFDAALEKEYEQAHRYHRPLSVIEMDIDLFKAINDTKGHQAGDRVIKAVADIIRRCCRKSDLPARLGGDEYAVLLPETQAASAAVVAERIRKGVHEEPIVVDGTEMNVTLSIGVADLAAGKIDQAAALLGLADEALYEAKQLGRDRFVLASDIAEDDWADASGESDRVEMLRGKLAGLDTQFKSLFVRALQEIVRAMERRDPHMADHARKVQHYSSAIGKQLNLSEDLIRQIEMAALLHDIGMLALPDEILLCPGRLEGEQVEMMRRHPVIGARILEGTEFLEQVIPVVRFHHERFDGKGYPDGLSGLGIPPICRIVAIADAFDAMTSRRSFRDAMNHWLALDEIRKGAGSQFDPDMVDAFLAAAEVQGEKFFSGSSRPTVARDPHDMPDSVSLADDVTTIGAFQEH